jgi:hypothetical protein
MDVKQQTCSSIELWQLRQTPEQVGVFQKLGTKPRHSRMHMNLLGATVSVYQRYLLTELTKAMHLNRTSSQRLVSKLFIARHVYCP